MQVREMMTANVRTVRSNATIREAAQAMADADIGALPVEDSDRLAGMITDRDIAVRAIAAGMGPDTMVGDVMSPEVLYCYDDDEIDDVCENLADVQVRRLPVVNRDKRLVGILSLADMAKKGDAISTAEALEGITRRGGAHSQSVDARM
jgi:CBS-domain-containing membrane protein